MQLLYWATHSASLTFHLLLYLLWSHLINTSCFCCSGCVSTFLPRKCDYSDPFKAPNCEANDPKRITALCIKNQINLVEKAVLDYLHLRQ